MIWVNETICDHFIHLEKRMWESQKVGKGKTPALRNFFAWHYECKYQYGLINLDPRLLIHGGAVINPGDKKVKSQPDTFLFDVDQCLWKKFFVLEQPSAREQHTLTKVGNLYYLFGGNQSPDNVILNELWCLNL